VDWLRRLRGLFSPAEEPEEEPEPDRGPVERSAPGIRAMFERLSDDDSCAVLDLGSAAGEGLKILQRFAGRVRFADLLAVRAERGFPAALEALPSDPERPFDLIFTWNTLDRLRPRERELLMERLAEISAPDARLHTIVGTTDTPHSDSGEIPYRFGLLDVDRIRYELSGRTEPYREELLPADVEELLAPFTVSRGYTLKSGLREYVAVRSGRRRSTD